MDSFSIAVAFEELGTGMQFVISFIAFAIGWFLVEIIFEYFKNKKL